MEEKKLKNDDKNISCNIFLEQLDLINQLPETERGNVLYLAVLKAFSRLEKNQLANQDESQDEVQLESQLEHIYISISKSIYLSNLSISILNLLNKTIGCKVYNKNWGGARTKTKNIQLENQDENQNESQDENQDDKKEKFEKEINILCFLNQVAKRQFKTSNKSYITKVNKWLKEYTQEEIQNMITYKTKEWLNDKKMCKYLRPDTLFSSKLPTYIEESKTYGLNNETQNNKDKIVEMMRTILNEQK